MNHLYINISCIYSADSFFLLCYVVCVYYRTKPVITTFERLSVFPRQTFGKLCPHPKLVCVKQSSTQMWFQTFKTIILLTVFRCLVRVWFSTMLKAELAHIHEGWNDHRIQHQPNLCVPCGVPNLLYYVPHAYGEQFYSLSLSQSLSPYCYYYNIVDKYSFGKYSYHKI